MKVFSKKMNFLAKNIAFSIKSSKLPQNNLIQPLWNLNYFWLVLFKKYITPAQETIGIFTEAVKQKFCVANVNN